LFVTFYLLIFNFPVGQKVHPRSLRIAFIHTWDSQWFADKRAYTKFLHEDIALRRAIMTELKDAGIARVAIYRTERKIVVDVYTSKPGILIGRQGATIQKLREGLASQFANQLEINVKEIKAPDLEAKLVAEGIARQIERRMPYRRASKQAIERVLQAGAQGVKVGCSGRLGGADIAREEYFKEGNIPLHTLRADIDFFHEAAATTYGMVGVKVWIYKGLVFGRKKLDDVPVTTEENVGHEDGGRERRGRQERGRGRRN
jgi:small subunit ribosomal protein S3